MLNKSRRHILAAIAGLMGISTLGSRAANSILTPRAAEGPFYPTPTMRRADTDNN